MVKVAEICRPGGTISDTFAAELAFADVNGQIFSNSVDRTIFDTFGAMSTQIDFELRKSTVFFINLRSEKIADILTALFEK